jgi:hypothetical protein
VLDLRDVEALGQLTHPIKRSKKYLKVVMILGDVWDSQNVRQLRSEIVGEQPREGRVHPVQYLDKM